MKAQVAADPSPFRSLERQAHRLQWLAVLIVSTVAVVPAVVFFLLTVTNLQADAERQARHLAPLVTSAVRDSGLDLQAVSRLVQEEMTFNRLASVRLLGAGNSEILRLGDAGASFGATEVTVNLPVSAAPVRELRVKADDRALLAQGIRVLGIHLLVAALLAVAVYSVPMRAMLHAIDEVEASQAQLLHSDKLSSIGEMYAGLTHEINNPLGIVLSRVQLMLTAARERRFPPDLIQDLEVIDRHGARIAEITRGLLAFARKTEFERVETDLNRVIGEVVALVERPFARQGIHIRSILDRALPGVRGSADHLQQVFLNLLNNARDVMPAGGTITLRTHRDGAKLVAEVRDTGPGIAPEVQARVFEPFFTTKDVGKGTGLGLAVSYGIVKAHGGELTVESRPGEGALFRVVLPRGDARS